MTAIEAIDALLAEEVTLRENRRIKIALLMARLSTIKTTASTRDLHARAPGFAIWTSYARRALAGAKTNPKLTSQPDHSIGAGHNLASTWAAPPKKEALIRSLVDRQPPSGEN